MASQIGEFGDSGQNDSTGLQAQVDEYKQLYLQEKDRSERLRRLLDTDSPADLILFGKGESMRRVKERIMALADTNAAVLIQGETGTGKEILARYLHAISPRRINPFVKVDCLSIPQVLIESELFGHEAGAFTDALYQKMGRFEEANGGTLFLDEIGNLEPSLQNKLIRALENFSITRMGGGKAVSLDIRLITASNTDLGGLIRQGNFREDLFFRIGEVALSLPALRERMEDIPDLCVRFIEELNDTLGKSIKGLSPGAYQKLYGHTWPGNIRELKNVIHKAFIFCDTEWIAPELIRIEAPGKPKRKAKAASSPVQA